MAGVSGRSGRRSKGPRHAFTLTRVSMDDAQEVITRAQAAGHVPYSEIVAALVHVGLQHYEEMPERFQAKEVLPEAS